MMVQEARGSFQHVILTMRKLQLQLLVLVVVGWGGVGVWDFRNDESRANSFARLVDET
jgi:hypothetical protein